jgi:uncharacterized protein (DUF58 family)
MSTAVKRVPSLFMIPFILTGVGLLLFLALLKGQRDLTVLSLLLFCVAAGAKLWTCWSLAGIQCSARIDKRRVFPDEKLLLKARLENRKWLPVWLEARVPASGLAPGDSFTVTAEAALLWYQKTTFRWELTAQHRGVHPIGPIGITTGDLFGFFPKEKEMAEKIEVVVYPRLVTIPKLTVPRRDFFGNPGADSPVQDPVYILGTRDYQQGQPAKYIHWKATARHQQLQEKIFEPSAQEKIFLVVNCVPFTRKGAKEAFERLLEQVASAAVQLAERGCTVGLITNGRMTGEGSAVVSPARNPRQMTALLEALARVQMEPAGDLLETLRRYGKIPGGISCLYFSLERDDAARLAQAYFRQRRIPFQFFARRPASDSTEAGTDSPSAVQGGDALRPGEGID